MGYLRGALLFILCAIIVGILVGVPVASGQSDPPQPMTGQSDRTAGDAQEPPARVLEILGGRGSEIGVSIRDLEPQDLERAGLPDPVGAVIDDVRSDSPAERAGLRPGDVLVEFDGERVRGARHLTRLVQETPVGRTVGVVVIRGGERVEGRITPEAGAGLAIRGVPLGPTVEQLERLRERLAMRFPRDLAIEIPDVDVQVRMRGDRLGIGIQDLTPQLADYFGVPEGVLVSSVGADSPAGRAGVRAGDVILRMNGAATATTREFRRQLSRVEPGDQVSLDMMRDRQEINVTIFIEAARQERRPSRFL